MWRASEQSQRRRRAVVTTRIVLQRRYSPIRLRPSEDTAPAPHAYRGAGSGHGPPSSSSDSGDSYSDDDTDGISEEFEGVAVGSSPRGRESAVVRERRMISRAWHSELGQRVKQQYREGVPATAQERDREAERKHE